MASERKLWDECVEVADSSKSILSKGYDICKVCFLVFFVCIFLDTIVEHHELVKVFLLNYVFLKDLLLEIVFKFSFSSSVFLRLRFGHSRSRQIEHCRLLLGVLGRLSLIENVLILVEGNLCLETSL